MARVNSSFKRTSHGTTDLNEQGDATLRTKPHTQHKKSTVHKKSLPPLLLAPTQKSTPRDLDIAGATSPAGSIQYFSEGAEGKSEDKLKPMAMNKKTLLRRSLQHKSIKSSIVESLPTKPASPGTSTYHSLDYGSELASDLMMKPPSQLRERHTEESLFPNLTLPINRGKDQITPIKPHPTSIGYLHYLADLIPGETDLPGESRPKNQLSLPPIDPTHKGHSHSSHTGTVTFNNMASVDPNMLGILEKLELAYRRGSRNVSRSVYWAKTINKSRKLQHSLKNSGIESNTVAGGSSTVAGGSSTVTGGSNTVAGGSNAVAGTVATGGRVSRILKKVLVSMEKN